MILRAVLFGWILNVLDALLWVWGIWIAGIVFGAVAFLMEKDAS